MSNTAVETAVKALWDYINSLPEDQKEKAIAYQKGLEEEASRNQGGVMQVISDRVKHIGMVLEETLDEIIEIASDEQTKEVLTKIKGL